MKLIVLFGPPAVGKMAVGYELERLTGLRLFHNHATIEMVLPFFAFGSEPFSRLVSQFRRRIFEEVASSELPGLIFTYVWALEQESDKRSIDALCAIFESRGADVHFVELFAELAERLQRNETELRLREKRSKRDLAWSRAHLLEVDEKHQLNTNGDFFYPQRHLRLDNTALSTEECAMRIAAALSLGATKQ